MTQTTQEPVLIKVSPNTNQTAVSGVFSAPSIPPEDVVKAVHPDGRIDVEWAATGQQAELKFKLVLEDGTALPSAFFINFTLSCADPTHLVPPYSVDYNGKHRGEVSVSFGWSQSTVVLVYSLTYDHHGLITTFDPKITNSGP